MHHSFSRAGNRVTDSYHFTRRHHGFSYRQLKMAVHLETYPGYGEELVDATAAEELVC